MSCRFKDCVECGRQLPSGEQICRYCDAVQVSQETRECPLEDCEREGAYYDNGLVYEWVICPEHNTVAVDTGMRAALRTGDDSEVAY